MIDFLCSNEISFRDLEELFFKEGMAEIRAAFRKFLEWLDQKLLEERDVDRYKVKGKRPKHLTGC